MPVERRCKNGYCLIPSGCFIKGSPPDEPYRGRYTEEFQEVTLTQSVLMQQHEVTQAEWTTMGFKNLAGTGRSADGTDCTEPTCPASMMTWFEAVHFANEKSRQEGLPACIELTGCTGAVGVDFVCSGYRQVAPSYYECKGYRLPTQYEFEYAIRAGTRTAFYSGPFVPSSNECIEIAHLNDTAWYCINSKGTTHPVGQKTPNPWGLHDMMGNASEYLASNPDLFDLKPRPTADPQAILDGSAVFGVAGGPYFSWPSILRSSNVSGVVSYFKFAPQRDVMGAGLGFRLVRTVTPQEAAAW
jgi:formylglycine-generating enzyme